MRTGSARLICITTWVLVRPFCPSGHGERAIEWRRASEAASQVVAIGSHD